MAKIKVNGVELFYDQRGTSGEPLVLVHGSWVDHHNWDRVAPSLAQFHQVITYDRRGHSQSQRPPGPGSLSEDAADLAALVEALHVGPAHIVGHSFGGLVVVRLATERPDLFRSLVVHEPPLLSLLQNDPQGAALLQEVQPRLQAVVERLEAGDMAGGVQLFVESIVFGPGEWGPVPEEFKQLVINNAPTFLDEMRDPDAFGFDPGPLRRFPQPILLTSSQHSPPFLQRISALLAQALPQAQRHHFAGAGHEPETGHPQAYVQALQSFFKDIRPESAGRTV